MTSQNPPPADAIGESSRSPAWLFPALEMLVLLVVLAFAFKAWSAWPSVPLADPDTWGYLNPALTWLSGLGFHQTDGRDWFYPTLLAMFLKTTGTFDGIVAWQKFLGLCSGIVMAAAWRCWVSMLPFGRWTRFFLSILGALPIFFQLINQQTLFFAMSIRPEAVLPLFVYGQLACLMGYCKYRWHTPRERPSTLLGVAAIVLAYACLVLKPSWYLATVVTSAPVCIGFFGRALPLKTRIMTPILGVAAALLLLSLPARLFVIPDGAARTLLPDALLCVHAEFVEKYLNSKLAAMPESDPEKARLRKFIGVLDSEIHNAKNTHKVYEKLGLNADYLMHSDTLSTAINDYAGGDRDKFRSFCFTTYFKSVFYDPLAYAKKIFDQFGHFVFPTPKTFFDDQMNLSKAYRDTAGSWSSGGGAPLRSDVREMYFKYARDIDLEIERTRTADKYPMLRAVRQLVAQCALPVELLFLMGWAVSFVWAPLRKLSIGGWAAFCLFLAPFGNAFGICIVHTLDIYRYRITYGGYLLFALSAMTVFIVLVVVQSLAYFFRRTRTRCDSLSPM